ncbi:MAG: endopeptidase La, partial [Candidatus Curtissbacteria bacterium]|nr:endopeptidase La [Candidatus Curtissbacteria bacterium]
MSSQVEKIIPAVPVRESVVFPHTETLLTFGRARSVEAVKAAFAGTSERQLAVFCQKDTRMENPQKEDLYEIGTLVTLQNILEIGGNINVIAKAISRIELEDVVSSDPYLLTKVSHLSEKSENTEEMRALYNHVLNLFRQAYNLGKTDAAVLMRLSEGVSPAELADQIASTLELKTSEKQALLEITNVRERLEKVAEDLAREIKILELERSIANKTQAKFEKGMKEAILRERKKTIEKELGEIEEEEDDIVREFKEKIKDAKMPSEVRKKAEKELSRFSQMPPQNPERSYIENYLEWLTSMPWSKRTPNNTSITKAAQILNHDHFGLEKVKERIVEYLAVMKLKYKKNEKDKNKDKKEDLSGPTILCFIGPPGVGKTSIGKSIAKSLGRKFVRMSLGGIRDEAEIRGHRRTYVGALPGRIIQGIKNAGTNNPVFMLDEIDKIGADFRGDPSSALLEALDPEQNREFSDHYLEVPFDLSSVMFICTGNMLDTIPPALRDRMEVIRFAGYTEEEKFHIGQKFLWTKQVQAHGLFGSKVKITSTALHLVVRGYSREAGVRELERMLAMICRKIARKEAENKKFQTEIGPLQVRRLLGPIKYSPVLAEKHDTAGISTGLAWTEVGGEVIFIEVALMPGKGQLLITGLLGEVMKESCQAAMSYVRSHWKKLGLVENFAKNIDVHIHVP